MSSVKRFLVVLLILAVSLVWTGLSCEPNKYVDSASGLLVNRSTPEDTILSYYALLNSKSFAAASKLYSTKAQKIINAEVLQQQIASSQIEGTSLQTVFPPSLSNKYAGVGFVRSVKVAGNEGTGQQVLGLEFVEKDGLSNSWAIVSDLREIPNYYRLQIFQELIDLGSLNKINFPGLQQYSTEELASIERQVEMLANYCREALVVASTPVAPDTKLASVDLEGEFIRTFAPYSTYVWSWKYPNNENLPTDHPRI